ncbi:acetylxylan esterase [Methylomonas montana]|uniref:acetylxylan esterase n=1 Tax=Methylomonas montana TaxID=3058963 RepID=UPI002659171F|nr:acetylxylan esterase [Methylomonas montana]WKJ88737.1 acetylxylan esterase [Methylomonas montana]
MSSFDHYYNYDPGYGYSLDDLLSVPAPQEPDDFSLFWRDKYQATLAQSPQLILNYQCLRAGYKVYDISYQSTDGIRIAGWLLEPESQLITQCIVVGHGYGGREQPDYHLQIPGAALLFPCFRGISRSRCDNFPDQPSQHVVHGIDHPKNYIIGGCVEDLWLAVSALAKHYPAMVDSIGYMGISFGGGIGALAAPWDDRIKRVHLNVPTFGNQPLRLSLPTSGSAAALKAYSQQHHHVFDTLAYYDAAVSARYAWQPLHAAVALFDPVVAPPGQFAIYNAWAADKSLFVLDAGHFDYPRKFDQERQLISELQSFFGVTSL